MIFSFLEVIVNKWYDLSRFGVNVTLCIGFVIVIIVFIFVYFLKKVDIILYIIGLKYLFL